MPQRSRVPGNNKIFVIKALLIAGPRLGFHSTSPPSDTLIHWNEMFISAEFANAAMKHPSRERVK